MTSTATTTYKSPVKSLVQLCFPVSGKNLPADHNYELYASISRKCPDLHGLDSLSIDTIPGTPDKKGKIEVGRYSRLLLRCPVEQVPQALSLAGQTLNIGGHDLNIKHPVLQNIEPFDMLRSRIVVIKGYLEPMPFLDAVDRQMQALGIHGLVGIPANERGEPKRLTLKVKKHTVVGFSVVVRELSAEDSIRLQEIGLGGKRRMGCGVFVSEQPLLAITGEGRRARTAS